MSQGAEPLAQQGNCILQKELRKISALIYFLDSRRCEERDEWCKLASCKKMLKEDEEKVLLAQCIVTEVKYHFCSSYQCRYTQK